MKFEWLNAWISMFIGLVLWFTAWQMDLDGWLPVSLFLGTIVPASMIVIYLVDRMMATALTNIIRWALIVIDILVLAAIIMLRVVNTAETFSFLGAATFAIWGTVSLGFGLGIAFVILTFQLVVNYSRVPSGRSKAVGAALLGVGGLLLVVPLQFIQLGEAWPLAALPALIIARMGALRLREKNDA